MFPRSSSYDSFKVSLTATCYQDLWCGDSNGGGIKLSIESDLWYNLRLAFPLAMLIERIIDKKG